MQKAPDVKIYGIFDVFVFELTMSPVCAFTPKIFIKIVDVSSRNCD